MSAACLIIMIAVLSGGMTACRQPPVSRSSGYSVGNQANQSADTLGAFIESAIEIAIKQSRGGE